MRRLLLALVFISMTAPVYAAWLDGAKFLSACESDNRRDQEYCLTYIAGAMDASDDIQVRISGLFFGGEEWADEFLKDNVNSSTDFDDLLEKLGDTGYASCRPVMSMDQAKRIAMKYLQERPERLHESAAPLVLEAMTEAFPYEIVTTREDGPDECPGRSTD